MASKLKVSGEWSCEEAEVQRNFLQQLRNERVSYNLLAHQKQYNSGCAVATVGQIFFPEDLVMRCNQPTDSF